MRTWLKRKYRAYKPTGKYQSKHNDGKRRAASRRKLPEKERVRVQAAQPLVTLVLLPSGKKTFTREER